VRALYIPASRLRASHERTIIQKQEAPFQQRSAGRIAVLRGALFSRDAILTLAA